jgi:hypothetical protein
MVMTTSNITEAIDLAFVDRLIPVSLALSLSLSLSLSSWVLASQRAA